ncbi:hypothetical protein CSB09_00695 [Candidatus Gracilibacteria bacterium]|nr:MAG: hypothetical protein CSB09_00695 [Candidatus Gracilibacteria bacterium]
MNTQEQIQEIYEILQKQESRRRWSIFFTWVKRIIFWGIIFLIIFYPQKILSPIGDFLMEQLDQSVQEFTEKYKSQMTDYVQDIKEAVKDASKDAINDYSRR